MIFKAEVQIVPQPFSAIKMSWQRHLFFGRSRVIKDLDFNGGGFHGGYAVCCIAFVFGFMQVETHINSQDFFSSIFLLEAIEKLSTSLMGPTLRVEHIG